MLYHHIEWLKLNSNEVLRQVLVGKTIFGIYTKNDGEYFGFDTDQGAFAFLVMSECCSTSWIENIDILADLPAKVLDVQEVIDDLEYGRFIMINTDSGYIDIDGRNDGGSSGMYCFTYSLMDTDSTYDRIRALAQTREDWKAQHNIQWFYAPGFGPNFSGFANWERVKSL